MTDETVITYSIGNMVIILDDNQKSIKYDQSYISLITTIKNRFPNIRNDLPESKKLYWGIKDRLKINNNIVLMHDRIVIPSCLRKRVLHTLHSARQVSTTCALEPIKIAM